MKKFSLKELRSDQFSDQIVHATQYLKGGDDPPAATLGKIKVRGGG